MVLELVRRRPLFTQARHQSVHGSSATRTWELTADPSTEAEPAVVARALTADPALVNATTVDGAPVIVVGRDRGMATVPERAGVVRRWCGFSPWFACAPPRSAFAVEQ